LLSKKNIETFLLGMHGMLRSPLARERAPLQEDAPALIDDSVVELLRHQGEKPSLFAFLSNAFVADQNGNLVISQD